MDADRPQERKQRFFVTTVPKLGLFWECSSTTISNRVKLILKECGIDISKFQSHILRSASMAAVRDKTDEALKDVLHRASVSEKVFSSFYDLPISATAGQLDGSSVLPGAAANSVFAAAGQPAKRRRARRAAVSAVDDSSGFMVTDKQIAAVDIPELN